MRLILLNAAYWGGFAQNVAQAAAIGIGGGWAYFKFIRGRTFHRRAELNVNTTMLSVDDLDVVRAIATMKNEGLTQLPLRIATLRVCALNAGDIDEKGRPQWDEIAHAFVFGDHDWIEPQETIADDVLIPVPGAGASPNRVALRVTCIAYARAKKITRWTANVIIPLRIELPGAISTTSSGKGDG